MVLWNDVDGMAFLDACAVFGESLVGFRYERPDKSRGGPSKVRRSLGEWSAASAATSRRVVDGASLEALDRNSFPILEQILHETNKPLVYLDSAATSQKPTIVLDTLREYYTSMNANVHRGAHTLSARSTEAYENARSAVQRFIDAEHREEIIFTRNATEAINLVAKTWAIQQLHAGDVVVSSVAEHHSNHVPWQMAAEQTGAVIKHVGLTKDQEEEYDLEGLRQILNQGQVKLVVCAHVSNVLGCINPVKEIAALAHQYGALCLVDACQSVPHMPVSVRDIDCDFLVASGHKMCGPTGIGFLFGKRDILNEMPPFLGGGEMIADVFLEYSTYAGLPHKFEAGTPAIGEAIGLGAAVEYLNSIGMDRIAEFEHHMGGYLLERLQKFKEVRIFGPKTKPRAGLCAFNIEGVHPTDLSSILDLEGVGIRSGHHCAQPLHRYFGVESSARASLYLYNNRDDVDRFILALEESVTLLGQTLTLR